MHSLVSQSVSQVWSFNQSVNCSVSNCMSVTQNSYQLSQCIIQSLTSADKNFREGNRAWCSPVATPTVAGRGEHEGPPVLLPFLSLHSIALPFLLLWKILATHATAHSHLQLGTVCRGDQPNRTESGMSKFNRGAQDWTVPSTKWVPGYRLEGNLHLEFRPGQRLSWLRFLAVFLGP